jgi:hypothetical protein
VHSFQRRFGKWAWIPHIFREFARDKPQWADVVSLLPAPKPSNLPAGPRGDAVTAANRHPRLADRPVCGDPLGFPGLVLEPVNEQGVVFLFGLVARRLGYTVVAIQTAFPDCEAMRAISPGNWQRIRIEFEFESRNFRDHGHPADGCDLIVCWRHNWRDCPPQLEIIELASVIKQPGKPG